MEKTLHLVSNAHLDPVWLWEWEEGAAEAISTFRVAADFCEQFDGYIFNHNEVVLYQWVEEYEPALFARIQRLVREGKWHIMGGWYVQPDCNMPSGETFVRQSLVGKNYFLKKFGVDVTTAINFDPFGHSRGLPQILAKSGYNSYLFCRPDQNDCPLPSDDFLWVGFDGSEIMAHRASSFYGSGLGKAREKVQGWLEANQDKSVGMILWGVGNHGGGASRVDLEKLSALMKESDRNIIHSTPDRYFAELDRDSLAKHEKDLNPWAVGCYTSIIRIKQKFRELENSIYGTEKIATSAWMQGLMKYPDQEINEALKDLLLCSFHDVLPGSCIQPAEEAAVRTMDHGLELMSRVKARAFFAMASGQEKPGEGEIPIFVYNPHPFPISTIVECEFQIPDQNWDDTFTFIRVHQEGRQLPCQVEKEASSIPLDWRKKVVFQAELAPSSMNRFDCTEQKMAKKPETALKESNGKIVFKTKQLEVVLNTETGFVDSLKIDGVNYVAPNAFQPLVIKDDVDPWGMRVKSFPEVEGSFHLMPKDRGTRFSGLEQIEALPSVRVVEDGEARTVIESVLFYGDSSICQTYSLPKQGTEIGIDLRVYWNEKDRMLKLSIPLSIDSPEFKGEVAYGVQNLPVEGKEAVAQKWVGVFSKDDSKGFTCINDGIYASSFECNELRLTLLRSPAYSGHPISDRPIVPTNRFTPRIDQGERMFSFWLNAGTKQSRLESVPREALAKNEKPFALSFYPSGQGDKPVSGLILSDETVQLTVLKKTEEGDAVIIRLFEPTGQARETTVTFPACDFSQTLKLAPFEIKTLRLDRQKKEIEEVNLLEKQSLCEPAPVERRDSLFWPCQFLIHSNLSIFISYIPNNSEKIPILSPTIVSITPFLSNAMNYGRRQVLDISPKCRRISASIKLRVEEA